MPPVPISYVLVIVPAKNNDTFVNPNLDSNMDMIFGINGINNK